MEQLRFFCVGAVHLGHDDPTLCGVSAFFCLSTEERRFARGPIRSLDQRYRGTAFGRSFCSQFARSLTVADFDAAALLSSLRRTSRCMRSTMFASTLLDLSRSALPNLTPLIDQLASNRDFGCSGMIKTPTKASQSGSAFTFSVIADSKSARERETRSSNNS
jgi:hypothetical protein